MKKLSVILVFGLLVFSGLKAQVCEVRPIVGSDNGISVLEVIRGDIPRFGEKALKAEQARLNKSFSYTSWFAKGILAHQLGEEIFFGHELEASTRIISEQEMTESAYGNGILKILAGKYKEAVEDFDRSEELGFLGGNCRLKEFRLIAGYLDRYGDEAPLFSHFNGGFFTYCQDSLRWRKEEYDTQAYEAVVESVIDLVVLSDQKPVYFELLGDLLSQNQDQVVANWFGASAYLRLMHLLPDHAAELEEKAFFALEAPMMVKRRFDNYQFIQFKKHIKNDLDAAAETRNTYTASEKDNADGARTQLKEAYPLGGTGYTLLQEGDESNVAAVIRKASKRQAENQGEESKFAGEVELHKAVKSDTKFNAYAFVMIGVVIFAVVFLGLQARRNRKNMS